MSTPERPSVPESRRSVNSTPTFKQDPESFSKKAKAEEGRGFGVCCTDTVDPKMLNK